MVFVPQGFSMGTTAPCMTQWIRINQSDSGTFQGTMASFADCSGHTV
jgi:hypothetical protein